MTNVSKSDKTFYSRLYWCLQANIKLNCPLRTEREETMEIKFTDNIQAAIYYAMEIIHGRMEIQRIDDEKNRIPAPIWTNFTFFSKVDANKINKREKSCRDYIYRVVNFYLGNKVVMQIKIEREANEHHGFTIPWQVKEIGFIPIIDGKTPSTWKQFTIRDKGLMLRKVMR